MSDMPNIVRELVATFDDLAQSLPPGAEATTAASDFVRANENLVAELADILATIEEWHRKDGGALLVRLARARAKVNDWAANIARGTSQVMSKAWSGLNNGLGKLKAGDTTKHAVGTFAGNMLSKGTDSLMDAANGVRDFERELVRFQIAGGKTPEAMGAIRTSIRALSNEMGVSSSSILNGAKAYVAITGDADGAQAAMRTFAKVAVASGSNMDDIAKTAASMRQNLKIDPKDFEKAFSILITQGKAGAIELSDLAAQLANVAPTFQDFAGAKTVGGLAEMGAMLQVVRENFGNADEAATGFRGMMTEIQRHQDKLKAAGVDIIDPKTGKMRDALEIITQISKNVNLMKPGALIKALGEEKAVRSMHAVMDNLAEINQLKEQGLRSNAVEEDSLAFQNSAAGKIDRTFNHLKETLSQVFTPERIERFAGVLERAVATVDRLVQRFEQVSKWIDENSGDSADEQRAKIAQQSAGKSAAWKEQAASDLDAQADELAPVMGMQNIADSWLGRIAHAGGAMPDASAFEAGNGAVQRQSAIRLRRSAGIQREDANRDAMYNDSTSDSWAGRNFAEKPTLAGAGFAPADTGKFLSDLKSTLVDAMQSAKGPTVKIGDNQVATSAAKSTKARAVTP